MKGGGKGTPIFNGHPPLFFFFLLHPKALHAAAAAVKAAHPGVTVEASGGISLETLPHFLGSHVDVVSMGCLTHGASALDFALRVLAGDDDDDDGTR